MTVSLGGGLLRLPPTARVERASDGINGHVSMTEANLQVGDIGCSLNWKRMVFVRFSCQKPATHEWLSLQLSTIVCVCVGGLGRCSAEQRPCPITWLMKMNQHCRKEIMEDTKWYNYVGNQSLTFVIVNYFIQYFVMRIVLCRLCEHSLKIDITRGRNATILAITDDLNRSKKRLRKNIYVPINSFPIIVSIYFLFKPFF